MKGISQHPAPQPIQMSRCRHYYTRCVRNVLLYAFACCLLLPGIEALGQEGKSVRRVSGSTVEIGDLPGIPAATEPCLPEVCEWWDRLREAGMELQRKRDRRATRNFVNLLIQGMERAYRVPVPDRPPLMLRPAPPTLRTEVRRTTNGEVRLSVEWTSAASAGEIKLISGLSREANEACIRSFRESIVLPAVKEGAFVSDWSDAGCMFRTSPGR
jgi:hypothetical protein